MTKSSARSLCVSLLDRYVLKRILIGVYSNISGKRERKREKEMQGETSERE